MTLPPPHRTRNLLLVSGAASAALLVGALPAQTPQPSSGTSPAASVAPANKPSAPGAAAPAAASDKSLVSYSLGVSMGEQLHNSGVAPDAVSSQRLAQGVHDAISGKVKLTDADRERISKLVRGAFEAMGEANHRAAAAFLAENSKKADVITTKSGLQYKVLAPGTGDSPKATDEVTVNYRGTLLNGTEFDSSYKRGQPAVFAVNRVIPGWTEALQLMKTGAKYQLFVPPQLAYDLRSPPAIPPGSMLMFEVELLSFKAPPPPPAAPAPGKAAAPTQAPPK